MVYTGIELVSTKAKKKKNVLSDYKDFKFSVFWFSYNKLNPNLNLKKKDQKKTLWIFTEYFFSLLIDVSWDLTKILSVKPKRLKIMFRLKCKFK